MGACSSCLGRDQDHDFVSEEDEQQRLLFDDSHAHQYGSFGEQNAGVIQADPQEVQRETEALQKVVSLTSNHLVDIFALPPQNAHAPAGLSTNIIFPAQDARLVQYQDVLAKISATNAAGRPHHQFLVDLTPVASDGWVSEDEEVEEVKGHTPVKSDGIGSLLGGFADAE